MKMLQLETREAFGRVRFADETSRSASDDGNVIALPHIGHLPEACSLRRLLNFLSRLRSDLG